MTPLFFFLYLIYYFFDELLMSSPDDLLLDDDDDDHDDVHDFWIDSGNDFSFDVLKKNKKDLYHFGMTWIFWWAQEERAEGLDVEAMEGVEY